MKKNLCAGVTAIFLNLTAGAAFADQACAQLTGVAPAASSTQTLTQPLMQPSTQVPTRTLVHARASIRPSMQQSPRASIMPTEQSSDLAPTTLLRLTDSDMDDIAAAGQVTATQAQASALKGNVVAFSITRLVASQMVGVSVASSLAIAVGVQPYAFASATARNF